VTENDLAELNDYQLRQVADGCFVTNPRLMAKARLMLELREAEAA
jgi:hypothetical protein